MTERIEHKKFYFLLGEVLRHMRKDAGITKSKMAAVVGVSLPKYIALEEGLEELSIYDLYLFACAIGISPGDILNHINPANYAK